MKALAVFGLIVIMVLFFNHHSLAQVSNNVNYKAAQVADTTKKKSRPARLPDKKKKNPLDSLYKAPEDRTKQPPPDTVERHLPK